MTATTARYPATVDQDLVLATWGLAAVTLLLVIATFVGIARAERNAKSQLTVLGDQTNALVESAKATQAMADEMLEVRKAGLPLDIDVQLADDAGGGVFAARLSRAGPRGIVLVRSEILVGKDRIPAAEPVNYANFYLGGTTNTVDVREPFNRSGRDLLILRVTGAPENGLEQSVEFHFRIQPGGGFERLSVPLQYVSTWA